MESETDNLREKNLSINADIKNKNQLILKNSIELKDIDKDKNRIVELKAKIPDLEKEINSIQVKVNEIQTSIQVVQHCKQLVSKQFRNFLLQDVVDFINKRLEYYSKYLYSNSTDIIKVISDSSKLDIMVGDTLYESLSGGEARKVDLALALAQRDLSLNISCSSSNIMILDEIMDNLDEHSSACAFDMILKSIDDLSSVYIISHNNYAIPYDSVLTVIKEKDKISHIKFSE